jgi:hypothetical protein
MTMVLHREDAYRDALRDLAYGIVFCTITDIVIQLRDYRYERAAQYRGYLWCLINEGIIDKSQADFVLGKVCLPGWDCWWFPNSWQEEEPPA